MLNAMMNEASNNPVESLMSNEDELLLNDLFCEDNPQNKQRLLNFSLHTPKVMQKFLEKNVLIFQFGESNYYIHKHGAWIPMAYTAKFKVEAESIYKELLDETSGSITTRCHSGKDKQQIHYTLKLSIDEKQPQKGYNIRVYKEGDVYDDKGDVKKRISHYKIFSAFIPIEILGKDPVSTIYCFPIKDVGWNNLHHTSWTLKSPTQCIFIPDLPFEEINPEKNTSYNVPIKITKRYQSLKNNNSRLFVTKYANFMLYTLSYLKWGQRPHGPRVWGYTPLYINMTPKGPNVYSFSVFVNSVDCGVQDVTVDHSFTPAAYFAIVDYL